MDHIQLVTSDYDKFEPYITALGFHKLFNHEDTYSGGTGMRGGIFTFGNGRANISLLEGIDSAHEKSQLTHYTKFVGPFCVQHMAISVQDIFYILGKMSDNGVKFVTPIVESSDDSGILRQIFTYPIAPGGPFFEFVQRDIIDVDAVKRVHEKPCAVTYSEDSVHELYGAIQQAIREGWWFKVDLFGNIYEE